MMDMIQAADWAILHFIHNLFYSTPMDFFMPKVTLLGDYGLFWILIALLIILRSKEKKYGYMILIALVFCFLLGNLYLKPLFSRPRPCWLDPSVRLLIPNETDFSFPSGHAMSSFAAATVLAMWKPLYKYCAYAVAGLIAFSRLYLYVHFPSDVIAGALIGILLGWLTYRLVEVILQDLKQSAAG